MTRTVAQVGDELYALPPSAFTAARDEVVGSARSAGDADLARAVASFKRPTVPAWLVNLVVLRHPELLDDLLALGDRMRTAQGAQVRELTGHRRAQLTDIQARAAALATGAGAAEPTRAQLAEVEATFSAAMVDPTAATAVRSARLLKPLAHGGFGGLVAPPALGAPPTAGRPAGSGAAPPPPGSTTPPRDDAARAAEAARLAAEAERARQVARDRVEEAGNTHDEAVRAEQAVTAEIDHLTDEIARLRADLDAAHRQARTARQTRLDAERDLASARRRLARLDPD